MQALLGVESHAKGKSEAIPGANIPEAYRLVIFVDFFENGLYFIAVAGSDLSGVGRPFSRRHV
jgi:hypothetical protein